jgi:hypothetical protein
MGKMPTSETNSERLESCLRPRTERLPVLSRIRDSKRAYSRDRSARYALACLDLNARAA